MNDSGPDMLYALQQELRSLESVHSALEAESLALSEGDVANIETSIQKKKLLWQTTKI